MVHAVLLWGIRIYFDAGGLTLKGQTIDS